MAEVGASERDVNATGEYLIERAGRHLWSGTHICLQVSVKTSLPPSARLIGERFSSDPNLHGHSWLQDR